jgi:hypothetical protein
MESKATRKVLVDIAARPDTGTIHQFHPDLEAIIRTEPFKWGALPK